jgi:hypothetical protein
MKALSFPSVTLVPRPHPGPAQINSVHQHREGFRSQGQLAANSISWLWPREGSLFQPFEARNTLPLEAMSFIDRTLTFGYYPLAGRLCPREPLLGSSVLWSIADPRPGSSTVHPLQSGALPKCDA